MDLTRFKRILLMVGASGLVAFAVGQMSQPARALADAASDASTAAPLDYAPVESFLKANCIDCHGPEKQKGDVTLHTYHDAASIIKDRKVWETVLEKVRAGEMPPKKRARPDAAQQEVFLRTIDQIFYRHDLTHPLDPGQVTIRRLNRTEYNNTIRDLCYVDSQPAEDFPSDDVGQGFDNIGDVLSISPVLMERYLAAANAVMNSAIPSEPPKPLDKYVDGRYMEPAINPESVGDKQSRQLTKNNSLFVKYTVHDEGEYTLRYRFYPDSAPTDEGEPAQVAILVDKHELTTLPVIEGAHKRPQKVEVKVHLDGGEHRLELALRRGWSDDRNRALRVNNLELIGPPDARPMSQRKLLECDSSLSRHDQIRQVLKRFATHAYRRAATDTEIDHLVEFAEKNEQDGQSREQAVATAMQAVLISPKFLFRVELDDTPDAAGPHPIGEYQLASRLSYFIWSTMPDDELLELAGKNQLTANLESQVRRMLQDPKADALVDNFALQWLQLRRLKNFSPDGEMFPDFSDRLRNDMLTETKMFIGSVFREDRSILDLIDADYTFMNERLAKHYGIADTNGNPLYKDRVTDRGEQIPRDTFVRVHLADHMRGGVLTEASVLAVTSNPTRTSPVKRGKFVLEQILGMPPPPPPPNVPQLAEIKTVSNGGSQRISLRQRMEQHRADPSCANCHEHMDGIGFAFENFDAVGAFRTSEGGVDIDSSGSMPDGEVFRGPEALKTLLKQRTDLFSRCLTKKMLIYAVGRGVEYYDNRSVEKIDQALKQNDFKFSTLVVEIVKSDPFRMRRGKEQGHDE